LKPTSWQPWGFLIVPGLGDESWELYEGVVGNSKIRWRVYHPDNSASIVDVPHPDLNEWVFIVATFQKGEKISLYYNGVKKGENVAYNKNIRPSPSDIYIGGKSGTTNYIEGLLDEVSIYNKALTESQIQKLYVEGLIRRGSAKFEQ
jgi:hypothetical protein